MENTNDVTASESIKDNMKIFGSFSLETKIPHIIDGLKKVHRRIIMKMGTTDDMDKVASVTGLVMKVHHHADGSISDTVSEMAKPYTNIIPFVKAIGNIGMYGGFDGPAAPRYLDVVPHPFTKDVYFNKIHPKAIKYTPTEDGKDFEPVNYIPAIPIALMINTVGIMIGYKTEIYPLGFEEICTIAKKYVQIKTGVLPISEKELIKYMTPDFPTPCFIRNQRELMREYKRNNFDAPIVVDGIMELHSTGITFRTLAPGVKYVKYVYTKLCDAMKAKRIKYIASIDNLSGDKTDVKESNVSIVLKRGVSPFDVLDDIKREIRFTTIKTPSRIYIDENGTGVNCTPFMLLDKWYTVRSKSIVAELKQRQSSLVRDQRKAEALVIAHASAKDIFNVFNTSSTWEEAVITLHKKYKLTPYQARYLKDLTMASITRHGKDELLANLQKVVKALTELQEKFRDIPGRMIEDIDDIYHKYKDEGKRSAIYGNFYGHVEILGQGVIRVLSEEEMCHVLANFKDYSSEIQVYGKLNPKHNYVDIDGCFCEDPLLDLPKEFVAKNFHISPVSCNYVIGVGPSKTLKSKSLRFKQQPNVKYTPVGEEFLTIDAEMNVSKVNYDMVSIKRLLYVSNSVIDRLVVITAKSSFKNTLRVHNIDFTRDRTKLHTTYSKDLKVLYVGHPDDDAVFTIPNDCVNSKREQHLRITNIKEIMDTEEFVLMSLGKLKLEVGHQLPTKKLSRS